MKKKSPTFTVFFFLAILFLPGLVSRYGDSASLIIVTVVVLAIALSFVMKVTKADIGETSGTVPRSFKNRDPQKPEDPRMKTFTKPEAPCIVCEHTGEDHLARDKANRIRQLDDWLKSGLIDRAEYRVLKDRYEKDL